MALSVINYFIIYIYYIFSELYEMNLGDIPLFLTCYRYDPIYCTIKCENV